MASVQAPTAVSMVRPHRFCSNSETFSGNRFSTHGGRHVRPVRCMSKTVQCSGTMR